MEKNIFAFYNKFEAFPNSQKFHFSSKNPTFLTQKRHFRTFLRNLTISFEFYGKFGQKRFSVRKSQVVEIVIVSHDNHELTRKRKNTHALSGWMIFLPYLNMGGKLSLFTVKGILAFRRDR